MSKKTSSKNLTILAAAICGLMTTGLTSCGKAGAASGTNAERNGCSGPNGCDGHGTKGLKDQDKKGDRNGCSGPNGCDGHGTKKAK